MNFKGVYIVHRLSTSLPSFIKDCAHLQENILELGSSESEANFQEVLWVCNNQFKNLEEETSNSYKRILIFTTNDFPNKNIENSDKNLSDYMNVKL